MQNCILITGGCGFIGSAVSAALAKEHLPVVVVDSLLEQVHPTQKPNEWFPENVKLFKADVCDPATWQDVLSNYRPSQVLHLAAETGTAQSLTESSRHAMVNVVGTTRMLDAFSQRGILPDRILLTSSRAVYGEGKWQDITSGRTFQASPRSHAQMKRAEWVPSNPYGSGDLKPVPHDANDAEPRPSSIYGATKLAQEHVLQAWCAAYNVPSVVMRLQNVYGEGQSPHNPYTGIINIFHKLARAGQSIPLYEDGEIIRDFVHIDDVAAVVLAALKGKADGRGTIDVGTGVQSSIRDAALSVADYHGAPEPHVCGKFRDGDVRSAVADTNRMIAMGITPTVSLDAGLRRVGAWLIQQGHI